MANWFTKRFVKEDSDLKALNERLDATVGELRDRMDYDIKFLDVEPSSFNSQFQSDYSAIDQEVDVASLQRIYASEAWVYAAVNAVAKTIAALPIKLEKKNVVKTNKKNKITGQMEEIEQIIWSDASGQKLLNRFIHPNAYSSKIEFFTLLLIDLLTAGEFYVYLDSDIDLTTITGVTQDHDDMNKPFNRLRSQMEQDSPIKGMFRVPPSLMKPVPSTDRGRIEGYLMQSERGVFGYNFAEIIHVKLPNPLNPFCGLSPLTAAFKPILLDRFSTEHMIRFYKSGARLGGVIESDKSLNKEQLGRFQRSFESNYTGRENHHRTLILPPGMKYNVVSQNPAETALLEFCKYNREAVLAAYNVPPIKIGVMDKANYANALVQLKMFFTDTIIPYLTFIEDGFNLKQSMMPATGLFRMKFDLSDVEALKDNYKDQAEAAKFMTDAGLTINEIRERVWDLGPIAGGDICPSIEAAKSGSAQAGGGGLFLSAPTDGVTSKSTPTQGLLDGMDPTKVTSIMNIIGRVSKGRLSNEAAITLMSTVHGVPVEIGHKLLGLEPPVQKQEDQAGSDNQAADSVAPTDCTYAERVSQLVKLFMDRDKLSLDQAIKKATAQALAEGFNPDDTPPEGDGKGTGEPTQDGRSPGMTEVANPELRPNLVAGGVPGHEENCQCDECKKQRAKKDIEKPTLAAFMADALSKLDEGQSITDELLMEVVRAYKRTYAEHVEHKENQVQDGAKVIPFGMTKDQLIAVHKNFRDQTSPLVTKRHAEVVKWFKKFQTHVESRVGANLKAYGLHKSRDSDDADEILSVEALSALMKQYVDEADSALADAYKNGAVNTLTQVDFNVPDELATQFLKDYGAKEVTYITETTRNQLRQVLTDSFSAQDSIQTTVNKIRAKFAEINGEGDTAGRAMTIARTETLSAVSAGQAAKRELTAKQFPDMQLKKMWVHSGEEKNPRDWHEDMQGETVGKDEEFSNGLKYPREAGGPPEEVINCGCTCLTIAAEDEDKIRDTVNGDDSDDDSDEKSFKGGEGSGVRGHTTPQQAYAKASKAVRRVEVANEAYSRFLKEAQDIVSANPSGYSMSDYITAQRAVSAAGREVKNATSQAQKWIKTASELNKSLPNDLMALLKFSDLIVEELDKKDPNYVAVGAYLKSFIATAAGLHVYAASLGENNG